MMNVDKLTYLVRLFSLLTGSYDNKNVFFLSIRIELNRILLILQRGHYLDFGEQLLI